MAIYTQFYIAPYLEQAEVINTSGDTKPVWAPKYYDQIPNWGVVKYAHEPWCLLRAVDADETIHALLAADPDILPIPRVLDQPLGASGVAALASKLDEINLPSSWLTEARTYRTILRVITGCFMLLQRYEGDVGIAGARIFTDGGVKLSRKISSLPAITQNQIQDAANSLGVDTSWLAADDTLDGLFRTCGLAFSDTELPICGEYV